MTAVVTTARFIHQHFLFLLFVAYGLAVVAAGPGLYLRDLSFGHIAIFGADKLKISASLLMLAFLLFNAGLGIKLQEIKHLASKPALPLLGFLANSLVPLLLIFLLRDLMGAWHNQDELQNLLAGLALIVAMPIAGSSTAWSQNANGNLSLSLGLVLISTICSPFTTPVILNTFGMVTSGDYSEDLQELAQQGTKSFMCLAVLIPSLLGIFLHMCLSESRVAKMRPLLKLINFILILILNYANASSALPDAIKKPDFDFLMLIFFVTASLCLISFSAGWALSRIFKTDRADMASLMFGLGMNNNGTGLVLASATLSDHPAILIPMVFYTLIQQVIASIVDWKFFRNEE